MLRKINNVSIIKYQKYDGNNIITTIILIYAFKTKQFELGGNKNCRNSIETII